MDFVMQKYLTTHTHICALVYLCVCVSVFVCVDHLGLGQFLGNLFEPLKLYDKPRAINCVA